MSSEINLGFTHQQIQILSDWILTQRKPFDNLNLPVIPQKKSRPRASFCQWEFDQ